VAIIYPDPEALPKFVEANFPHLKTKSMAELVKLPEINRAVEQQLAKIAKQHQFNSLEKVRGNFKLVADEF